MKTISYSIRKLNIKDRRQFNKLNKKLVKIDIKNRPELFNEFSMNKKDFKYILNSDVDTIFGVFDGKKMIGTAMLLLELFENKQSAFKITNLYVDENYRHQGIASDLIKTCIDEKKKLTKDLEDEYDIEQNILIDTYVWCEDAYRLYKKLGFKVRSIELECEVK